MSGSKNVYDYITTEGKRVGKVTALEYLQKNTGVFNQSGMISKDEVIAMKNRVLNNTGNIWHGFISFNKQQSTKIDTPEKCIGLVKNIFPSFLKDAHLNPQNIDLMCALHLDRPHHLHIHFIFWEKEPKLKGKNGTLKYRPKGKISEKAIDNMFVRLGLFVDKNKDELHKTRDEAIKLLRETTNIKRVMKNNEKIRNTIIALSKDLPKTGRMSYGSKEMESFRGRVDNVVKMLLDYDKGARKADEKFYAILEEKQKTIENICGKEYVFTNKDVKDENNLPKYHKKIDVNNITIIDEIRQDYIRRQGNLVLKLAKFVKVEYYERKEGKRYKPNDSKLKRSLLISSRNVQRRIDKFLRCFAQDLQELFERDFSRRLQEIEKEIEQERKKQNGEISENYKEEITKD